MKVSRGAWVSIAWTLPFVGILIASASHYYPFFSDDALISLRYVDRLVNGEGLTWTDGQPVEGYSNLLWILILAIPGMLGFDLILAARALGVTCMAGVLLLLVRAFVGRVSPRKAWVPMAGALVLLSVSAPMAVWSIGGLEQPLCALLIAASITLMFKVLETGETGCAPILGLSIVLGLLCLARPDGPIFAVSSSAALFLVGHLRGSRRVRHQALLVLAAPFLFYVGQVIFRYLYYDDLIPNTARVKISPSRYHAIVGLKYYVKGMMSLAPLSVIGVALLVLGVVRKATRERMLYLLFAFGSWSLYIIFVGGDIFPAGRHLVPLIVILAFAFIVGTISITEQRTTQTRARKSGLLIGMFALLTGPFVYLQFTTVQNQKAVRERWEWEGEELALLLKASFAEQQPLLAVTAAGCLPYWSELPALDMLGLNDRYLPRHPPAGMGSGRVGHELGDGAYVLRRNPDIIVFHVGSEPRYLSGEELNGMPEFHSRYTPVQVGGFLDGRTSTIYMNKYSDRIGMAQTAASLTVPGFLFTGEFGAVCENRGEGLALILDGLGSARVELAAAPIRNWEVEVDGSEAADIQVDVEQDEQGLSIMLTSKGESPTEVHSITLRSKP